MNNTGSDAPTDMIKTRFVVLPTFLNSKDEVCVSLAPEDDCERPEKGRVFTAGKATKHLTVGHVYEIEHNDTSYRLAAAKWIDRFGDNDLVIQWQAADRAFDLAQKHAAKVKRLTARDLALEEQLEPLRRAYQALPTMQRLGFELWVLSVLRRRS